MTTQHNAIINLIEDGERVLDLGCGDGDLLHTLFATKHATGYGIEINYDCVKHCIEKGLSVFHGDLDEGLTGFADKSYDTVILSQTLQQVQRPLYVIEEMLRVGKRAIITFPNFAHWSVRLALLFGRIPQTKDLPYDWYDTPNIRVANIQDFRHLCRKFNYEILTEVSPYPRWISNLLSPKGFFVIQKKEG